MPFPAARTLIALAALVAGPAAGGDGTDRPVPLGLAAWPGEAEDARGRKQVALGRRLFLDPGLSRDGSVACSTCHVPEQAFAHRGEPTSAGVGGRRGRRNTPSILNAAFLPALFHDGRAATLEEQAWQPILAAEEMGNDSVEDVLEHLAATAPYPALFREAFGVDRPTERTVAQALARYQRTLVSGNAPFDRWNWGGESDALGPEAERGYRLFAGRAQCWQCHPLNGESILFTDHQFHDTGVAGASPHARDDGRFEATGRPRDRGHFRTPSLRNVALTAPYMHDGSLATLEDVVRFYDRGGSNGRLQQLDLEEAEVRALVAFLEALTGDIPDA